MKTSIILTTMFSAFLFASVSNAQQGWSSTTNIFDLRVFNGSIIYGQASSLDSVGICESTGVGAETNQFRLDEQSPFFAEVYSILLTAQATNRRVQLYRTGECQGRTFTIVNGARLLN